MNPTAPPQNFGSPSTGTNLYSASSASSACSGSSPGFSVRLCRRPFRITVTVSPFEVNTAKGSEPRKEWRPTFSPPSTLSSKNAYWLFPIFRKADTGVSVSSSTSFQTGIRFPCFAFSLNSALLG